MTITYDFGKVVRVRNSRVAWLHFIGAAAVSVGVVAAYAYTGAHLLDTNVSGSARLAAVPPGRGCRPKAVGENSLKRCPLALNAFSDLAYCKESSLPYSTPKLPCDIVSRTTAALMSDRIPEEARVETSYCVQKVEYLLNLSDSATAVEQQTDVENVVSKECAYAADAERYWIEIKRDAWFLDTERGRGMYYEHVHAGRYLNGYYFDKQGHQQQLANDSQRAPSTKSASIAPLSALEVVISDRGMFRRSNKKRSDIHRNIAGSSEPSASTRPRATQPRINVEQWDDSVGFTTNKVADFVQVRALLKLANMSLDVGRNLEIPEFGPRYCGVNIHVELEYTNAARWMGLTVTPFWSNDVYYQYTVHGYSLKTCSGLLSSLGSSGISAGKVRTVASSGLITVRVNVGGTIYQWNWWRFFLSLSMVYSAWKAFTMFFEFVVSRTTTWFDQWKFETYDAECP